MALLGGMEKSRYSVPAEKRDSKRVGVAAWGSILRDDVRSYYIGGVLHRYMFWQEPAKTIPESEWIEVVW